MADSDEGTDGSSLRPVSSLRSHFENMASLKQPSRTSHATPQVPSPRLHGQRDYHAAERVSLEIPRRPSPLSVPGNPATQDSRARVRAPKDLNLPAQGDNQSLRRRPISMTSLSSPRSPPIVTIDSPLSPPKQFVLPEPQIPLQYSSADSSRSGGIRSRSLHAVPTPPRRSINASPIAGKGEYAMPINTNTLQEPKPIDSSTIAVNAHSPSSSVPPPVNRAEKPKFSTQHVRSGSNVNCESHITLGGKRVSPLSTPRSSVDNIEFDSTKSRQGPMGIMRPEKGSHFQPAAINDYVQPRKGGDIDEESSTPDTYIHSNFQPSSLTRDVSQFRPGLPPRQEVDKTRQQFSMSRPIPMPNKTWTEQIDRLENPAVQIKPRIPAANSNVSTNVKYATSELMPPPKRSQTLITPKYTVPETNYRTQAQGPPQVSPVYSPLKNRLPDPETLNISNNHLPYPDTSKLNRRPPYFQQGIQTIETHYDTRLFDMSGRYICTTGYLTRAWDLFSGDLVLNLGHDEKETQVTALAFKPGASFEEEGVRIWLGTNYGDIQEVDIPSQTVLHTKSAAHGRREIVKILRYQNSMWTLDDDGILYIWSAGETGLPSLEQIPTSRKVPKGHSCSLIIQDTLWIAAGKEIRVFRPNSEDDATFTVTRQALSQPGVGEITSGTMIAEQPHCVYFGHADGKVTTYSTTGFACLGVFNVSLYRINSLAGAGSYLWAGFNSGVISVYDTNAQPWSTKKEWQAHDHPVANIVVDCSSIWKFGDLQVASIGIDNTVRLWDGMLEQDWLETDMQNHDTEYCDFREIKAVVMTWNAGASTPGNLRADGRDVKLFREVIQTEACPDLLVFGFQELVDLDDKKLTAKSLFKGNKHKDSSEHEHMSRQYRAWRDYLDRFIEDNMPPTEPYQVLHTASMVGLFTCVFVKVSQRSHINNLCAAEIKRGLGGLHGNKGALITRFVIDNSSICLVNCHLAAGQSQTAHRNNDVAAILDSTILPSERNPSTCADSYVGGGDGSMVFDHEICILNGDLNYRIDTMGRDTVIKAVNTQNYAKLLDRDQLLVSRRRNPDFRLRAFTEFPINFAPTYKYDVGSDKYDTSEKHRAPAWCDRILYRGTGNIKQLEYRRHELKVSDHRPVSGSFKIRVKTVSYEKRPQVWKACKQRFESLKFTIANKTKNEYFENMSKLTSKRVS